MQAISLVQFTRKIAEIYESPRYSPATHTRLKMVLAQLQALGAATTADLTTKLMVHYVASLRESGIDNSNTINGYLSSIQAACTFAIEEGWLCRQPTWRRVRLTPSPMVKNEPPEFEDLCRLLVALGSRTDWEGRRLASLAWLISMTGVRLREALYARLDDLDLTKRVLRIDPLRQPARRLKTAGSAREVPIPIALADRLEPYMPDAGPVYLFPGNRRMGPWDGGSPSSKPLGQLQAAARDVGIERLTWHALRHAYGTFALSEWGVPLWVVQHVMGHRSIRTTEHYLHLKRSKKIWGAVQGIAIPL